MTTRHDRPTRGRARRSITAAAVAVAAFAGTLAGAPIPAQAAVPKAAQAWSNLMYRSLTPSAEGVRLRKLLTVQRAAVVTKAGAITKARAADAAARTGLANAATTDVAARARRTSAEAGLTRARAVLTKASRQRPQGKTAVTRAKTAVTRAAAIAATRRTEVRQAATALLAAQSRASSAAGALTTAVTTWKSTSAAVRVTQQKIAALPTGAALAGQAGALSRDVVTQVRAGFTIADTTTVYSTTVHKSVAYAFQRMVDAAKADGIALSGGGFRTTQRQIELRTINGCPDVWTAPASSCRVPTAIPGRSLHEIGLAVDITSGGRTISAKTPAFAWLVAHAARYGFVNLPTEAWHWSITGG